jgi:hypothetical protein
MSSAVPPKSYKFLSHECYVCHVVERFLCVERFHVSENRLLVDSLAQRVVVCCKNTGDELWYQGLLIALVARARGDSKLVIVNASCRVCVSVP